MKGQVQKGWKCYLALWKELTGWKLFLFYALHYTLLFVLLSHFVFRDFEEANKTFIWLSDGPGYFARIVYLSQTIRDGIQSLLSGEGWTIPLYDFQFGTIKPTWGEEPIQLLAVFWPWDRIDEFYDAMVLVRYYLIGLSFSIFGFYFGQSALPVLTGAISYAFCGFAIYAGVRHPFFMAPMIFLPLLIIGTEKILKKERPFLLIATVFLAVVSNLYFACMLAIIVSLYALVRFFTLYEKNRGREFVGMFGRLALSGGIGLVLSGAVLVPVLMQMLDTGRVGRDITAYVSLFKYASSYYLKFLPDFIVVPGSIGSWTCLGFSVLAVPAIILLFVRRPKEQRTLRILFLILTAMLLVPVVAYVMSGFNTISNRWCFMYAFCVCAIIMIQVPRFAVMDKQTLAMILIGTIGYFAICYFLIDHAYFSVNVAVLLIVSVLSLCIFWFLEQWGHRWMLQICVLITCFSVCYSAFLMYDADQGNYISEFTEEGQAYQYFEASQYSSFSQSEMSKLDQSFYRVAGSDIAGASLNTSFYYGINGLTDYSSLQYPNYVEWLQDLELARKSVNIRIWGLQSRSHMLSLAGVKYYVLRETGKEIEPYGFQAIERIENNGKTDVIMENQFALSIGYTYDSYFPYDRYEQLSALERQDAQIQAVILTEFPVSSDITEAVITSDIRQVPVTIADSTDLSWKNGVLKVKKEKATLTLAFEGISETETYLRIVNLDLTSGASTRRWNLTASTDETATSARFAADAYVYSHGQKTQLLDLGYTEDGYTTCTITFPSKGTFKLEDLEIWCQPMENYGTQVNALREEILENVETNWRGLTGTISVSRDKMLCIAIPYDKGWTAYVDGKKAKIYQANTAFMAIELPAGEHEIELRYWLPGLTLGIALSTMGVAGLTVLIIYWKKKNPYLARKERL